MAVIDALQALGITGLAVKWPNDIVSSNGKVGGILMEVAGEQSGPCHVVVGIGLNVGMSVVAGAGIEQAWSNISNDRDGPSRNEVVVALLDHLFEALQHFETNGPNSLLSNWDRYDYVRDKEVNVHLHGRIETGIAKGIDANGFLAVRHGDKLAYYSSGEISLRLAGKSDDSAD